MSARSGEASSEAANKDSTVTLWCDRCGEALSTGTHEACAAARALEPPRYCPQCRRRMKVQVLPAGWRATCAAHGTTTHPDPASRRF